MHFSTDMPMQTSMLTSVVVPYRALMQSESAKGLAFISILYKSMAEIFMMSFIYVS